MMDFRPIHKPPCQEYQVFLTKIYQPLLYLSCFVSFLLFNTSSDPGGIFGVVITTISMVSIMFTVILLGYQTAIVSHYTSHDDDGMYSYGHFHTTGNIYAQNSAITTILCIARVLLRTILSVLTALMYRDNSRAVLAVLSLCVDTVTVIFYPEFSVASKLPVHVFLTVLLGLYVHLLTFSWIFSFYAGLFYLTISLSVQLSIISSRSPMSQVDETIRVMNSMATLIMNLFLNALPSRLIPAAIEGTKTEAQIVDNVVFCYISTNLQREQLAINSFVPDSTALSSTQESPSFLPEHVKITMSKINQLYCLLDFMTGFFSVQKIKSSSTRYMVAVGLESVLDIHSDGTRHSHLDEFRLIASFALASQTAAESLGLTVSAGITCGPVVTGMLGLGVENAHFDVYGDTINTAARIANAFESGVFFFGDSFVHPYDRIIPVVAPRIRDITTAGQVCDHGSASRMGGPLQNKDQFPAGSTHTSAPNSPDSTDSNYSHDLDDVFSRPGMKMLTEASPCFLFGDSHFRILKGKGLIKITELRSTVLFHYVLRDIFSAAFKEVALEFLFEKFPELETAVLTSEGPLDTDIFSVAKCFGTSYDNIVSGITEEWNNDTWYRSNANADLVEVLNDSLDPFSFSPLCKEYSTSYILEQVEPKRVMQSIIEHDAALSPVISRFTGRNESTWTCTPYSASKPYQTPSITGHPTEKGANSIESSNILPGICSISDSSSESVYTQTDSGSSASDNNSATKSALAGPNASSSLTVPKVSFLESEDQHAKKTTKFQSFTNLLDDALSFSRSGEGNFRPHFALKFDRSSVTLLASIFSKTSGHSNTSCGSLNMRNSLGGCTESSPNVARCTSSMQFPSDGSKQSRHERWNHGRAMSSKGSISCSDLQTIESKQLAQQLTSDGDGTTMLRHEGTVVSDHSPLPKNVMQKSNKFFPQIQTDTPTTAGGTLVDQLKSDVELLTARKPKPSWYKVIFKIPKLSLPTIPVSSRGNTVRTSKTSCPSSYPQRPALTDENTSSSAMARLSSKNLHSPIAKSGTTPRSAPIRYTVHDVANLATVVRNIREDRRKRQNKLSLALPSSRSCLISKPCDLTPNEQESSVACFNINNNDMSCQKNSTHCTSLAVDYNKEIGQYLDESHFITSSSHSLSSNGQKYSKCSDRQSDNAAPNIFQVSHADAECVRTSLKRKTLRQNQTEPSGMLSKQTVTYSSSASALQPLRSTYKEHSLNPIANCNAQTLECSAADSPLSSTDSCNISLAVSSNESADTDPLFNPTISVIRDSFFCGQNAFNMLNFDTFGCHNSAKRLETAQVIATTGSQVTQSPSRLTTGSLLREVGTFPRPLVRSRSRSLPQKAEPEHPYCRRSVSVPQKCICCNYKPFATTGFIHSSGEVSSSAYSSRVRLLSHNTDSDSHGYYGNIWSSSLRESSDSFDNNAPDYFDRRRDDYAYIKSISDSPLSSSTRSIEKESMKEPARNSNMQKLICCHEDASLVPSDLYNSAHAMSSSGSLDIPFHSSSFFAVASFIEPSAKVDIQTHPPDCIDGLMPEEEIQLKIHHDNSCAVSTILEETSVSKMSMLVDAASKMNLIGMPSIEMASTVPAQTPHEGKAPNIALPPLPLPLQRHKSKPEFTVSGKDKCNSINSLVDAILSSSSSDLLPSPAPNILSTGRKFLTHKLSSPHLVASCHATHPFKNSISESLKTSSTDSSAALVVVDEGGASEHNIASAKLLPEMQSLSANSIEVQLPFLWRDKPICAPLQNRSPFTSDEDPKASATRSLSDERPLFQTSSCLSSNNLTSSSKKNSIQFYGLDLQLTDSKCSESSREFASGRRMTISEADGELNTQILATPVGEILCDTAVRALSSSQPESERNRQERLSFNDTVYYSLPLQACRGSVTGIEHSAITCDSYARDCLPIVAVYNRTFSRNISRTGTVEHMDAGGSQNSDSILHSTSDTQSFDGDVTNSLVPTPQSASLGTPVMCVLSEESTQTLPSVTYQDYTSGYDTTYDGSENASSRVTVLTLSKGSSSQYMDCNKSIITAKPLVINPSFSQSISSGREFLFADDAADNVSDDRPKNISGCVDIESSVHGSQDPRHSSSCRLPNTTVHNDIVQAARLVRNRRKLSTPMSMPFNRNYSTASALEEAKASLLEDVDVCHVCSQLCQDTSTPFSSTPTMKYTMYKDTPNHSSYLQPHNEPSDMSEPLPYIPTSSSTGSATVSCSMHHIPFVSNAIDRYRQRRYPSIPRTTCATVKSRLYTRSQSYDCTETASRYRSDRLTSDFKAVPLRTHRLASCTRYRTTGGLRIFYNDNAGDKLADVRDDTKNDTMPLDTHRRRNSSSNPLVSYRIRPADSLNDSTQSQSSMNNSHESSLFVNTLSLEVRQNLQAMYQTKRCCSAAPCDSDATLCSRTHSTCAALYRSTDVPSSSSSALYHAWNSATDLTSLKDTTSAMKRRRKTGDGFHVISSVIDKDVAGHSNYTSSNMIDLLADKKTQIFFSTVLSTKTKRNKQHTGDSATSYVRSDATIAQNSSCDPSSAVLPNVLSARSNSAISIKSPVEKDSIFDTNPASEAADSFTGRSTNPLALIQRPIWSRSAFVRHPVPTVLESERETDTEIRALNKTRHTVSTLNNRAFSSDSAEQCNSAFSSQCDNDYRSCGKANHSTSRPAKQSLLQKGLTQIHLPTSRFVKHELPRSVFYDELAQGFSELLCTSSDEVRSAPLAVSPHVRSPIPASYAPPNDTLVSSDIQQSTNACSLRPPRATTSMSNILSCAPHLFNSTPYSETQSNGFHQLFLDKDCRPWAYDDVLPQRAFHSLPTLARLKSVWGPLTRPRFFSQDNQSDGYTIDVHDQRIRNMLKCRLTSATSRNQLKSHGYQDANVPSVGPNMRLIGIKYNGATPNLATISSGTQSLDRNSRLNQIPFILASSLPIGTDTLASGSSIPSICFDLDVFSSSGDIYDCNDSETIPRQNINQMPSDYSSTSMHQIGSTVMLSFHHDRDHNQFSVANSATYGYDSVSALESDFPFPRVIDTESNDEVNLRNIRSELSIHNEKYRDNLREHAFGLSSNMLRKCSSCTIDCQQKTQDMLGSRDYVMRSASAGAILSTRCSFHHSFQKFHFSIDESLSHLFSCQQTTDQALSICDSHTTRTDATLLAQITNDEPQNDSYAYYGQRLGLSQDDMSSFDNVYSQFLHGSDVTACSRVFPSKVCQNTYAGKLSMHSKISRDHSNSYTISSMSEDFEVQSSCLNSSSPKSSSSIPGLARFLCGANKFKTRVLTWCTNAPSNSVERSKGPIQSILLGILSLVYCVKEILLFSSELRSLSYADLFYGLFIHHVSVPVLNFLEFAITIAFGVLSFLFSRTTVFRGFFVEHHRIFDDMLLVNIAHWWTLVANLVFFVILFGYRALYLNKGARKISAIFSRNVKNKYVDPSIVKRIIVRPAMVAAWFIFIVASQLFRYVELASYIDIVLCLRSADAIVWDVDTVVLPLYFLEALVVFRIALSWVMALSTICSSVFVVSYNFVAIVLSFLIGAYIIRDNRMNLTFYLIGLLFFIIVYASHNIRAYKTVLNINVRIAESMRSGRDLLDPILPNITVNTILAGSAKGALTTVRSAFPELERYLQNGECLYDMATLLEKDPLLGATDSVNSVVPGLLGSGRHAYAILVDNANTVKEHLSKVYHKYLLLRDPRHLTPLRPVVVYNSVGYLCLDVANFTKFNSENTAADTLLLVSSLFNAFDRRIALSPQLIQVKSVGDSYEIICVPVCEGDPILPCILLLICAGWGFIEDCHKCIKEYFPAHAKTIDLRVGISCGPVFGSLLGNKQYRFDFFGAIPAEAELGQSLAQPGRLLVSRATYDIIRNASEDDLKQVDASLLRAVAGIPDTASAMPQFSPTSLCGKRFYAVTGLFG